MSDWKKGLAQNAAQNPVQELRPGVPDLKSTPSSAISDEDNAQLEAELDAARAEGYGGSIEDVVITEEEAAAAGAPAPPVATKPKRRPTMKSKKVELAKQQAKEVEEPVEEPIEESAPQEPIDYLATLPGAPSTEQIEKWKAVHKDIYMMPLEGGAVFIFRYLTYYEWKHQLQSQEALMNDQDALKQAVLQRCVLHPEQTPETQNAAQGGLPELMFEIIMKASYFIDAGDAMMQVMRL